MFICDLETFFTAKCVSRSVPVYTLSEVSGKYDRDKTDRELEKCKNDCGLFKGTNWINDMLDYFLSLKGEAKRVINKIVKYIFFDC